MIQMYQTDFQIQYTDIQQKILELTASYKQQISNVNQFNAEQIDNQVQTIAEQVEQKELLFRKQNIYTQFATVQEMSECRKNHSENCPNCGVQIEKITQCQFCAEVYCKSCCWRKRVIPFVSKQLRLCCEVCHHKFIKLFDNSSFYEEKETLTALIGSVRARTNKLIEKKDSKFSVLDTFKNQKRNEKMKENNLQKKIREEQKKLKATQQEFEAIIIEKANKIKKEEERLKKLRQEEERQQELDKENERIRLEQQELQKQKQKESKHTQSSSNRSQPSQKVSAFPSNRSQSSSKSNEYKYQKTDETVAAIDSSSIKNEKPLLQSNLQASPPQITSPPHQNIPSKQTVRSSISGKEQKKDSQKDFPIKKVNFADQENEKEEVQKDEIEQALSKIISHQNKDDKKSDDEKSCKSSMSKLSKNVLEMSVNQLLTLRVSSTPKPAPKSQIFEAKFDEQEKNAEEEAKPTTFQANRLSTQEPHNYRMSIEEKNELLRKSHETFKKIEQTPLQNDEQLKIEKLSILRNSSLISSTHKEPQQPEIDGRKNCTCVIM